MKTLFVLPGVSKQVPSRSFLCNRRVANMNSLAWHGGGACTENRARVHASSPTAATGHRDNLSSQWRGARPAGISSWPAKFVQLHDATSSSVKPVLLDPCAAALNQDDQNDDEEHAGDNLDNRGTVHNNSPFLSTACFMCSQSEQDAGDTRRQSGEIPGGVRAIPQSRPAIRAIRAT